MLKEPLNKFLLSALLSRSGWS